MFRTLTLRQRENIRFLSDEGTLDYTIRIDSTPTFSYFDLYPIWNDIRAIYTGENKSRLI